MVDIRLEGNRMLCKGDSPSYNADGVHNNELGTLQYIANWCDVPFPFSRKDGLERYGIVGILGYIFLSSLLDAHIIEIGTGESSIYLTEVARRLHRKIFCCDATYSKIFNPLTVPGYLHEDSILLTAESNEEYDQYSSVLYAGTSDDFFAQLKFPPIGIAFIDGDHHYEYIKRDFDNIFKLLVPNGVILLHDTYPCDEWTVLNDYCSTAYKMRQELEKRDDLDCFTFTSLVACGVGLTMCRKKPINRAYYNE